MFCHVLSCSVMLCYIALYDEDAVHSVNVVNKEFDLKSLAYRVWPKGGSIQRARPKKLSKTSNL